MVGSCAPVGLILQILTSWTTRELDAIQRITSRLALPLRGCQGGLFLPWKKELVALKPSLVESGELPRDRSRCGKSGSRREHRGNHRVLRKLGYRRQQPVRRSKLARWRVSTGRRDPTGSRLITRRTFRHCPTMSMVSGLNEISLDVLEQGRLKH